jgi:hypothetical protein
MLTSAQIETAFRDWRRIQATQMRKAVDAAFAPLVAKVAGIRRGVEDLGARIDHLEGRSPAAKGGGSTPGRGLALSSPGRLGHPLLQLLKAAPPGPRVPFLDREAALRKSQAAAAVGTALEDETAARADRAATEADQLALLKRKLTGPGLVTLEQVGQLSKTLGRSSGPVAAPPRVAVTNFETAVKAFTDITLPSREERRAHLQAERAEIERALAAESRTPRLVEALQTNMIARKLLG